MGFLSQSLPKPPPPPNQAQAPLTPPAPDSKGGLRPGSASLISTSTEGLKRKADTQRTSLLGGA